MKLTRIPVEMGNREYDVVVGCGMLLRLGEFIKPFAAGKKIGVVVNPRVNRLYGQKIREGLRGVGSALHFIFVPEGEQHKTLSQVARIYDQLVADRFERSSLLIAFGGGVIGDMTGFVAATFLRGVSYIQCPTTVIAQVDAAIGGKTGVDHPKGKNLIGAFHQPSRVFVDLACLQTLSKREYVSGLAEIIKYGVIYDPRLFNFIEKNTEAILKRDTESLAVCVRRSVQIKAAIVAADERESGLRKILNYGHTWGHALEAITGYQRYKHGEAIAIGMMAAAKMAHRLGIGSADLIARQHRLFKAFGLPTQFPRVNNAELLERLYLDKKVMGEDVHFVLPKKIGSVCVQKVERAEITATLKDICLN